MGFKRINSDYGVFVSDDIFIVIYVDDHLIFGNNTSKLQQLQHELKSRLKRNFDESTVFDESEFIFFDRRIKIVQ